PRDDALLADDDLPDRRDPRRGPRARPGALLLEGARHGLRRMGHPAPLTRGRRLRRRGRRAAARLRASRLRAGDAPASASYRPRPGQAAGPGVGAGIGHVGSCSPWSSRNGGYSGVISAAYAITRNDQRLKPITRSKRPRGYSRPMSSRTPATNTSKATRLGAW